MAGEPEPGRAAGLPGRGPRRRAGPGRLDRRGDDGPAVARARLGRGAGRRRAGGALRPVGPPGVVRRGARPAPGAGAGLPLHLHARRHRAGGVGAARRGRGADLPGDLRGAVRRRRRGAGGVGAAVRVAVPRAARPGGVGRPAQGADGARSGAAGRRLRRRAGGGRGVVSARRGGRRRGDGRDRGGPRRRPRPEHPAADPAGSGPGVRGPGVRARPAGARARRPAPRQARWLAEVGHAPRRRRRPPPGRRHPGAVVRLVGSGRAVPAAGVAGPVRLGGHPPPRPGPSTSRRSADLDGKGRRICEGGSRRRPTPRRAIQECFFLVPVNNSSTSSVSATGTPAPGAARPDADTVVGWA